MSKYIEDRKYAAFSPPSAREIGTEKRPHKTSHNAAIYQTRLEELSAKLTDDIAVHQGISKEDAAKVVKASFVDKIKNSNGDLEIAGTAEAYGLLNKEAVKPVQEGEKTDRQYYNETKHWKNSNKYWKEEHRKLRATLIKDIAESNMGFSQSDAIAIVDDYLVGLRQAPHSSNYDDKKIWTSSETAGRLLKKPNGEPAL